MAGGTSALGTTYNLPNYTGILHSLSPAETPLYALASVFGGVRQANSTEFEWSTYDLRDAAQNTKVQGAAAPTADNRVRANVSNVVQVHQETVGVAYSKLAATGLKSGTNNDLPNNVPSELDWQVEQMLKQIMRDVEYSMLLGSYVKPGNNSSAAQTRGLYSAISTNRIYAGAAVTCTFTDTGDKVGATSHGLVNGDSVVFSDITTTTGASENTRYYVVNKGTNDFEISATAGGSAIALTTNGTGVFHKCTAADEDHVNELAQAIFDSGQPITDSSALVVPSTQKRAFSKAYATAYGSGYTETSRTEAGVNFTQLHTDFGPLNVVISRNLPTHRAMIVDLAQLHPVWNEIPGKGHLFAEPLAKTGASENIQLYGEFGLEYGPEQAHGVIEGLL